MTARDLKLWNFFLPELNKSHLKVDYVIILRNAILDINYEVMQNELINILGGNR